MRRFLPRSTTAVGLLLAGALFASATGGAVAGSVITGKQIKNGTVTGKDLKDGSVGTADLAKGVPTSGPAGPAGPAGAPGLSGAEVILVEKTGIAPGGSGNLRVECPAGKVLLSAEAEWGYSYEAIQFSRPEGDLDTVFAFYINPGGIEDTVTATAVCAKLG